MYVIESNLDAVWVRMLIKITRRTKLKSIQVSAGYEGRRGGGQGEIHSLSGHK